MNIYRNFADAAHKAGMDTDEYVYILRTTVKRLGNKNVTNGAFLKLGKSFQTRPRLKPGPLGYRFTIAENPRLQNFRPNWHQFDIKILF